MNERILITGASGFIGTSLTRHLVKRGYQVYSMIRPFTNSLKVEQLRRSGATCVYADITDIGELLRATRLIDVDIVVHLAGLVRRFPMSPCYHDFFRANVVGTRNVCKLAFIKRVRRFIHVSSIDVHGPIPRHLIPISEDHPLNPTESYEKTKAQAEKIVRWYADQGLPIIILRPAYVYGPGDRGYFHPLIQMIHQLPFIPLLAAGRALKHLICIDDLIRALELSLSKGKLGGIYFVGEHYPITIREILALLCRAFSIRKPFINLPLTAKQASIMSYFLPSYMRYFLAWFYKNYGCRIDAIKRDMDFNPSITLEQVLFRSPPNTIYLGGNN